MTKLVERKNIGKIVLEPFQNLKIEKVKKTRSQTSHGHGGVDDGHSSSTSGPDDDENEDRESEEFHLSSSP